MWVVVFHIWGAVQRRDTDWVPSSIQTLFEYGFLGVDIFFVLSGFVITYSLIGKPIDRFFVPRFILRRSIRIDPPYWATIGLAIAFILAKNTLFSEHREPLPSLWNVVAHVFYLQDLLEFTAISSVFWTLCLEFQFYIVFAIAAWILPKYQFSDRDELPLFLTFFAFLVMIISPYFRFTEESMPIPGTIFPYIYEFLLGILTCLYLTGRFRIGALVLVVATVFVVTIYLKSPFHAIVPVATVLVLIGSSRGWRCLRFLFTDSFQFLGKVSYSLYLTHAIVGWAFVSVLVQFLESWPSSVVTSAIFASGLTISVVFSYIFYCFIEKIFIRLSKKLKVRI